MNMGSSGAQESGTLSTFLAGALLGAGIALLLAPQSGAEMRGLLRDYASRAKDQLDDALDQGTEAYDAAMERGHQVVEKGKESLREAGRQVKSYTEAGTKAVKDAQDELASQPR